MKFIYWYKSHCLFSGCFEAHPEYKLFQNINFEKYKITFSKCITARESHLNSYYLIESENPTPSQIIYELNFINFLAMNYTDNFGQSFSLSRRK